jgi:hypothetical protein
MNETQTRKYEMLTRVREFAAGHAPIFPPGTFAATLLAQIHAAIDDVANHSAVKAAGNGAAREGTANRALARQTLRDDLEVIGRTARTIALRLPNVGEKFRLPVAARDQALLDAARAFAADAVPLAAEFALHELSSAFFAKLDADIAAFEQAFSQQRKGRETRIAATAAIEATLLHGVRSARQLDTIMRNRFAGDPVSLQAWSSARRIQRTGRGPRPQQPVAGDNGQ